MKKLLVSVIAVAMMGGVAYAADMQQSDASVGLNCLQLIELVGIDMAETVTPGPEDYARDLMVGRVVNNVSSINTGSETASENVMSDLNDDIGKGFAERNDALSLTIFTNAQDGAALFVHGLQPATQKNILRLEDTYITVEAEKTYILINDFEGAYANACTGDMLEGSTKTANNKLSVEDNPRNGMGAVGNLSPLATDDEGNHIISTETKAYSTWLRIHNEAQHIFEVKMSTKAPRLIVFKLGIANLARYTEGEYTNTLTFTLMPIVG
ncbi:MAG: hypothetical protein V1749_05180 [Candidatus Desantisbacteria bacterium]